jgi:UDP-N-acetylmuramoyl-tripeptide--D-alanyl-D-alanine ligase
MFYFYFYLLAFFWFLRQTRTSLFWLYLWQLKEYHLGRFLAHFQTSKGKRIFFNPLFILKILLFLYSFFLLYSNHFWPYFLLYSSWIFVLTILYFFESLKGLGEFFRKNLRIPILTSKTFGLISLVLISQAFYLFFLLEKFYFVLSKNLYLFSFFLLIFDILSPLSVTFLVFLVHSLSVLFYRNPLIKRAKLKREEFKNLLVVGITGSFGKTSTKEFLATILAEKFKVLKTKEHQNSEVAISSCILNDLKKEHEIFVVEMGAYNKGGIKLLCDITKPKIGIITGINEQHLATFGSWENLLSAEGGRELIESLPPDGIVFLNAKNKYCLEIYKEIKITKKLYGEGVEISGFENLEGAKAVAKELGMTDEEIERGVKKIQDIFPGIKIGFNKKGWRIFNASYSANPDGVSAHLDYLKTFEGKKIIIMPCLIELGSASKKVHQRIGEKIAQVCDLAIITTSDRLKELREGFLTGGGKKENIFFLEKSEDILKKIEDYCQEGDNLLLEGRVPKELVEALLEDK